MLSNHDQGQPEERAGRWLRFLSRNELGRLLGTAIQAGLTDRGGLDVHRARLLSWDVQRRFFALARARTRRVRGLTKAECLQELERKHARFFDELTGLEQQLARARTGWVESGLDAGQEQELTRALEADVLALLSSAQPHQELSGVLEREGVRRAQALAGALAKERARIDLLERRIAKLRDTLASMERALAELARRAQVDQGLPSIYRTVQGLDLGAVEREAKSEILTRIFQLNLRLQGKNA